MKLAAELIPAGSFILRGWYDEQDGTDDSGAPIEVVAFLMNLGDGDAEVAASMGRMTRRMLLRLCAVARESGFRRLFFSRTSGPRLGWAEFLYSSNGFDFYRYALTSDAQGAEGCTPVVMPCSTP